ncbi:MAG TPA: MDR family MFS transporter [Ktedonobacteraceae bacterium]|nr:MDR family MFS transporter [Ktedonobacteraceae bacterium]
MKQPKLEREHRLRGIALVSVVSALMLTLLLEALDQTIVGTALPRIVSQLHGFDRYTWVVTAYLLASTAMVPLVGKLSDQFGRKWFLVVGVIIFLLGSMLAGASQSINQLIAFRALQGLGAGIGIALVITVIGDIFTAAERAKWQAAFGAVYGFANFVGPAIGGWLTDHGPLLNIFVTEATRWRWVFYINLPVGILALAALLICLPSNISIRSSRYSGWNAIRHIDFLGAVLAAAATTCLLLGLTWGSAQGGSWGSPLVIGTLVAAVILYVLFFITEHFAVEPILPLSLFRKRVFTASALLTLLQGMVLLGLAIYLPLFFQRVQGMSPTNAGIFIIPFSISIVIGSLIAGFVVSTSKRYQMVTIVGTLVMTVGAILLTLITVSIGLLQLATFMVVAGLGTGALFSTLTIAAQNALPRSQLGVGTAAIKYVGQLGPTLGVAIVGTVVNHTLASANGLQLNTSSMQSLTATAIQHGFVAVVVFAVVAIIVACFLKDLPMVPTPPQEETEDTAITQEVDLSVRS